MILLIRFLITIFTTGTIGGILAYIQVNLFIASQATPNQGLRFYIFCGITLSAAANLILSLAKDNNDAVGRATNFQLGLFCWSITLVLFSMSQAFTFGLTLTSVLLSLNSYAIASFLSPYIHTMLSKHLRLR